MPATRETETRLGGRKPRRPLAVALSVAAHLALLFALTRIPVPASEASIHPPTTTAVVWIRDLPAREIPPPEPEPVAVEGPAEAPPETVAPSPERVTPPAPKRSARRKPPVEEPVPVPPAVEPPVQTAPPPRIDWDKERQTAVRATIEQPRAPFTYDPLPEREEQPLPIEPAPPAMTSRCVIFKNRFQAALLGMMGVCVRDARDDLFVDARPPYVDEHPVCRETQPDSPGAVASDGRVISTVKCDLVVNDDNITEVKVEADLDAQQP
jgi:hypothetical protein